MTIRVGVVGSNFGAVVHAPAFRSEGADVVLCGRDRGRLEAAAARAGATEIYTSFDELLADPELDAVSIAAPASLHAEMAIAALRAGKHVLVEKPFARSVDEARQMLEAARSSAKVAMVAHEFRYASARRRVSELIADGYIGAPRFALARMVTGPTDSAGPPRAYRREDDDAGEGAGLLFRLGSHYIDCFRSWFGEVTAVSASLSTLAPDRVDAGQVVSADADDTFSFRLEFASGCLAEMFGTRQAPFGNDFGITVYGSEGILATPQVGINPSAHGELTGTRFGEGEVRPLEIPSRLQPFVDDRDDRLMPFRLLVQEFLNAVRDGGSPSPNFDDGYRCELVLEAARQAAASRQTVFVETA